MGLFTPGIDVGNSAEEKQKLADVPFLTKVKNMFVGIPLHSGADEPNSADIATYDRAVENHDKQTLIDLARKDPTSQVGQIATRGAITIHSGEEDIKTLTAPIAKAVPGSPEANIAAANTFQTVKDNPKYGTALVRWLMGDKVGAGRLLTGGDETDSVVWDANGNSYTQTTNSLGQRVGIVDAQNKPITREEADARKIGYSAYENTIAAKNRTLNAENNVKQYAKDTQAENIFTAGAAADALKGRFIRDSLNSLPKEFIKSDWYANTMGGVAQQLSRNQRQSTDLQNLDSYDKSVSNGQSTTVDKGMTSRAGWPGVFTLGADGKLVNENGEKHNLSELKQIIKGSHSSQEQGDTFNKTLESIMTSKQLIGLTSDQQSALRQALVYSKEIADSQAERLASVKELGGRPAFTVLPSASNILDRRAQVNAQTYQLDYNDETMKAFNKFKQDVMPQYEKTGSYPSPRELQAKFVDTPAYKAIQDKYAKLIKVAHDFIGDIEVKDGRATTNQKAVPARPPLKALLKAAGG
jgi:hypothetical protein